MNQIVGDLHETAIDTMSRLFNKRGGTLIVEIRNDNFILQNKYDSDSYSLFKFHGTTFGIKEKETMPPEIKFTIDADRYNIELNMRDGEESSVVFREKGNKENFISLKVV